VTLGDPKKILEEDDFLKLIYHENMRIFCDRVESEEESKVISDLFFSILD
jgi:hypothetical protein